MMSQELNIDPLPPRNPKKIWIDLDNSPHVSFFKPIIEEFEKRGYSVFITARNRFQVCELADRYTMQYRSIGRYYGKNKLVKLFWLVLRAIQLIPLVINEGPALALAHGSRAQEIVAKILRVPSVGIFDYEHAKAIPFFRPTWLIAPQIMPNDKINKIKGKRTRVLKYPGIEEDVYVPYFKPDSSIINELGLGKGDLIITIRPPAYEAHYYDRESGKFFEEVMSFLITLSDVKMILLPRNEKQKDFIQKNGQKTLGRAKLSFPIMQLVALISYGIRTS